MWVWTLLWSLWGLQLVSITSKVFEMFTETTIHYTNNRIVSSFPCDAVVYEGDLETCLYLPLVSCRCFCLEWCFEIGDETWGLACQSTRTLHITTLTSHSLNQKYDHSMSSDNNTTGAASCCVRDTLRWWIWAIKLGTIRDLFWKVL